MRHSRLVGCDLRPILAPCRQHVYLLARATDLAVSDGRSLAQPLQFILGRLQITQPCLQFAQRGGGLLTPRAQIGGASHGAVALRFQIG